MEAVVEGWRRNRAGRLRRGQQCWARYGCFVVVYSHNQVPGSDYGAELYLVQQDELYVLVPVDLEYYDY